jgi:hypothetical protein
MGARETAMSHAGRSVISQERLGGRAFQSIKVQVQFLRTIHLEVMPDSNAELDGITIRGVLSMCKGGLFTGGWYVEQGPNYRR